MMPKKQMVSVYPIRYLNGIMEHLIIKRATVAYNWQCITGGVNNNETTIEAAHRELFEETGYKTKFLTSYNYSEDFMIDDEPYGKRDKDFLEKITLTIENIVYIALIETENNPVLNPKEHTDWLWCNFQMAYEKILWAIEKKQLRLIFEFINSNGFQFEKSYEENY